MKIIYFLHFLPNENPIWDPRIVGKVFFPLITVGLLLQASSMLEGSVSTGDVTMSQVKYFIFPDMCYPEGQTKVFTEMLE